MAISAKEIVIIFLGLIGSLILGLLIKNANIEIIWFKDYIIIVLIVVVVVSAIIIVI